MTAFDVLVGSTIGIVVVGFMLWAKERWLS